MKLQRTLAVIGAGVLLFAASDAITYAATGSSLVLGAINRATSLTTIQNTGPGSALRLVTSSSATPPLIVNGKGKVTNLYADRSATADNATKLGGRTPAQVAADAVQHLTPARVIWVARGGGNFTTVSAALAAIHDNSEARPYLIKVAPGTYNEPGSVAMKDHVDIEGSGQDNTVITCSCGGAMTPLTDGSTATIRIDAASITTEIRNLTVTNTGGGEYSTGVWVGAVTTFRNVALTNVSITATGGTGNYALVNRASRLLVTGSVLTAEGVNAGTEAFGVFNVAGALIALRDVSVYSQGSGTGRIAVYNDDSNLEADTSIINGADIGISNTGADPVAYVSMTSVWQSALGVSASYHCVGAFTALYVSLNSTCA